MSPGCVLLLLFLTHIPCATTIAWPAIDLSHVAIAEARALIQGHGKVPLHLRGGADVVHHATERLGAQHAMGGEHMFVETVTASAKMAMEGELGPHGVRIRQAMLVDLTSASLRGLMHRSCICCRAAFRRIHTRTDTPSDANRQTYRTCSASIWCVSPKTTNSMLTGSTSCAGPPSSVSPRLESQVEAAAVVAAAAMGKTRKTLTSGP